MTETTWDTNETGRIIANDEGLYDIAIELERTSYSIDNLADRMEEELSHLIEGIDYSDINMSLVDWTEIAADYFTEDEDETIMCTCDQCGCDFKEDDLIRVHYADASNASRQQPYMSPCCHSDYEYLD